MFGVEKFDPDTLKLQYFDLSAGQENVCQAAWNSDDSKTAEVKLAGLGDPEAFFCQTSDS